MPRASNRKRGRVNERKREREREKDSEVCVFYSSEYPWHIIGDPSVFFTVCVYIDTKLKRDTVYFDSIVVVQLALYSSHSHGKKYYFFSFTT